MTTNQSCAVTDDSLQQKQMSSRPSGSATGGLGHSSAQQPPRSLNAQQHKYLVNENYDKSEVYTTARSYKSSKHLILIHSTQARRNVSKGSGAPGISFRR